MSEGEEWEERGEGGDRADGVGPLSPREDWGFYFWEGSKRGSDQKRA